MNENQTNTDEMEENDGKVEKQEEDPYAYLDRGEFSSENFKIEIKNLPKFYGISELRKLLNNKLKLNSNKIKTPKRNSPYAFICFRNEEDRDKAIKTLSDFKWKGKQLQATYAKASADPLVKKRRDDSEGQNAYKKQKTDDLPQDERIQRSTIPLANLEYDEQLKIKQEEIRKVLKKLGNDLAYQNLELKKWIEEQKEKHDGLPCQLLDIRYSDQIDGYRNKCEFTIGIDQETNLPTVGFRIGAYVNGITGVAPVESLRHIPESMKVAVRVFQDFVRSSELQVFNPEFQTGHFRQLCVRSAPGQLMVIVGLHPQNLDSEKIAELKGSLLNFFTEGAGKEAKVTSLYYQEIVKKNPGESPTPAILLWGETYIYETILGLKFRISPEAFFQINTKAAEILYESAIELAEPTDKSSMIDVCCGTGTIGLCFAKKCDQILGLEIVPQAIVDAKENAVINNITTSEFFAGKAEEILGSVCFNSKNEDVFAVVDPPRAGLLKKHEAWVEIAKVMGYDFAEVKTKMESLLAGLRREKLKGIKSAGTGQDQRAILQLRKITKINRLIYVSCNPNLALKNFVDLGRPESKSLHGEFFVPTKAVAVDLFPHTKHCELVVCFKRWDLVKKEIGSHS